MPGLKERAKTLIELIESAQFLYADRPLALDDKASAILTPEARTLIKDLLPQLEATTTGRRRDRRSGAHLCRGAATSSSVQSPSRCGRP